MHPLALALALLLAPAHGQKPEIVWQKQRATFDYQSVSASGHSLADFKSGQFWMLGKNRTSVLRTSLPIVLGERVVAPGAYPIWMSRTGEASATLHIKSSGKALGATDDVTVAAAIGMDRKPAAKLVLGWQPTTDAKAGNQPTRIVVHFGTNDWHTTALLPGNVTTRHGAWTLTVWTLPATLVATRSPAALPIATLTRGEEAWNLLLAGETAQLLPAPVVDEAIVTEARLAPSRAIAFAVERLTAAPGTSRPLLESLAARVDGEQLSLDVGYGGEALRLRGPLPPPKK